MAKDKITEYDATAANNTVVGDVNLAENSALPSDMNNAVREVMSHQKEAFGSGTPLYVDQTNDRLGVGTASPSKTLHVSNGTFSYPARIASTGGTTVGLEFTNTGSGANPPVVGSKSDDIFFETSNSERARILSSGGITFNGDTAAANALDDYEEGTWTPTFTASDTSNNPTITYSHQTGKYVKVGALVHIDVYIRTTAVTGTTGGTSAHRLRMDGLPFQADSQGSASSSFSNLDGMSNGAQIQVSNGSSRCVIKELDGDVNNNDMFTNDLGTGSDDNQLFFSLTYRTDS